MRITIPLSPVAKSRPKFGKGHAYTPEKTKVFEESVRWILKGAGVECLIKPVPIKVSLTFYLTQPKRGKWDYPTGKPDLDNLLKCLDSANGILWEDDSQIVEIHATKKFAKEGYIEMEVEEWTSY